jgi:hypothetical protein
MQSYQVVRHRVHIAIADLGLGIPATLSPDILMSAAIQPICSALEMGCQPCRYGWFRIVYCESNCPGQRGSLTIRADCSMLQLLGDRVYLWDDLTPMPGTQVYITVWGNHDTSLWEYLLPEHLT